MQLIWQTVVLVLSGILLLRLAGRKSIAQMTLATTVVMISIGSVIIQPIVETSVWRTVAVVALFVAVLIVVEFLEMKFNMIEKLITGKSIVVVDNGKPVTQNMAKLRLTVDKLEMQLRQKGIEKISDIKTATMEPNGQIGYELMPDAKPLTVGEFKKMLGVLVTNPSVSPFNEQKQNIFSEITQSKNEKVDQGKLQ